MKKEKKAHQFIVKPYYPGGSKAMGAFISSKLKYPKEALKEKIEGHVMIILDINHKGKVIKTKVKQSLGYGCDEEAERICKLLLFKLDQVVRKGRTIFHKTIRIGFKLPKKKVKKIEATKIQYQIIKKGDSNQSKPPSYNYTINL